MSIPVPISGSPYGNGDPFVSNPRMVTESPRMEMGTRPMETGSQNFKSPFGNGGFACDCSINTAIKEYADLLPLSSCSWRFCQIALFTHAVDEYPETERGLQYYPLMVSR